jgi:hypothetical protein
VKPNYRRNRCNGQGKKKTADNLEPAGKSRLPGQLGCLSGCMSSAGAKLLCRNGNVLALHILQASSFAAQAAKVIELGATDFGRAHDVHFIDDL